MRVIYFRNDRIAYLSMIILDSLAFGYLKHVSWVYILPVPG